MGCDIIYMVLMLRRQFHNFIHDFPSLFILFSVFLVLSSDVFGNTWFTIVKVFLVLEFFAISIIMAIYLWLLVKRLDEISHLNFITEKQVIICTSVTFMVTYVLRALFKLVDTINEELLLKIMFDELACILFELVPMFVI